MRLFEFKIALNILSFMVYGNFCAIYLQIWSRDPDVKRWRKKNFPEDLAVIYLVCGIIYLFLALANLLYIHVCFVILTYKDGHKIVDELKSLLFVETPENIEENANKSEISIEIDRNNSIQMINKAS